MKNVVQSMSTLMLALGLLVPVDGLAQSTSLSPTADIILEVTAAHYGMHCAECADRYLYLRLFFDGTAECQFSKRSAAEPKESPAIKKTLTEDEFIRIKSAVNIPKLAKVWPRYDTWYGVVDTSTEWKIEIHRTDQTQVIEVLNFSPGFTKLMKHPYPNALVKLGCNLQKLRADVIGESPSLDSECKKVLGVRDQPKS